MDRFNFFTGSSSRSNNDNSHTNETITDNTTTNTVTIRTAAAPRTTSAACNSSLRAPPGPHPATVENYSPYSPHPVTTATTNNNNNPSPYGLSYPIYQSYDPRTSNDEHAPLSPRFPPNHDPESQHPQPQRLSFLARFPRPSFFGLRPPSSNYSGAGLRGAPPTVINQTEEGGVESPKSPLFRIGEQHLPSTRLHLPNLERSWTVGSNGPPTRPGTTARQEVPNGVVDEPEPVITRGHRRSRSGGSNRSRRHHRRNGSGSRSSGSSRSQRDGDEGETTREERRQRRRDRESRRRRTEQRGSSSSSGSRSGSSGSRSSSNRKPPKNFLFCFPWIKSRRIRTQILRCFVSGLFLILILTVYLSLTLTKNITASEFTILLILVILFITIFFCHSLIKLCMLVVKSRNGTLQSSSSREGAVRPEMIQQIAPGGYAIPREPIRVVLARDEEAAGIESEATKLGPPAYGLWRESVRVDPDRFYWARNQAAAAAAAAEGVGNSSEETLESGDSSDPSSRGSSAGVRRPPSYASDDGVSYVVEARPRSMAPPPLGGEDAAGLHPVERERLQQQRPSVWV
ncbi:hypothetical protein QBC36DRAFT_28884 [Triangularia setosa]|uniref:Uncharacterized protein n=1 Tax=Triangularia setosa TaxID=2587417 RepID=A0AAN6W4L3_9PEZI|nr:hypothetical protein QBC36DRAFT_28884 [Podospora setosa]